jgi:hypothetical protein
MSEKQIKECIPYTSSSNQNRSNKEKEIRNKKNEERMHSFSRVKCDREREKKRPV